MTLFWKYFFPPLYALLIYGNIRLVNDLVDENDKFWERPWIDTFSEIGACILFSYIFVYAIRQLEQSYLNRKLKAVSYSKIGQELGLVIALIFVLLNLMIMPVVYFTDDGMSDSDYVQINIITTLYFIIYFSIRRGNYYVSEFASSKLKIERLENDRLQSELDFLKGQFSPHFLFNSLNNIYFQINKDVAGARLSIEKLSHLLQYQLYQDQRQTISLEQECSFVQLYADVHKLRRPAALKLQCDLVGSKDEMYPHLFLPLTENAFKYVEGEEPFIRIKAKSYDGRIHFSVVNSCRDLPAHMKGGLGIKNLRRRLELLYPNDHKLELTRTNGQFEAYLDVPTL